MGLSNLPRHTKRKKAQFDFLSAGGRKEREDKREKGVSYSSDTNVPTAQMSPLRHKKTQKHTSRTQIHPTASLHLQPENA